MKTTRKVVYRRSGKYGSIPCLIMEGAWLTDKYNLSIGDKVNVKYQNNQIVINLPIDSPCYIVLYLVILS